MRSIREWLKALSEKETQACDSCYEMDSEGFVEDRLNETSLKRFYSYMPIEAEEQVIKLLNFHLAFYLGEAVTIRIKWITNPRTKS